MDIAKRIDKLIEKMTLEEKAAQMTQLADHVVRDGKVPVITPIIQSGTVGSYLFVNSKTKGERAEAANGSRLKIPPIYGIDAIHGHACLKSATVFPSQLAMASSFDPDMLEAVGEATSDEVAADGHHWVFSPVFCIGRDVRWGRVDETFGEDVTLAGRLGAAMVRGYQKSGLVAACAKHYLGYGEATGGRDAYDTCISERKARELFLKPFKAAIDAGCMTVMTAYGSIDASPLTTSHRWMTEILKEELGFDGFVVTDWTNIEFLVSGQQVAEDLKTATADAINAGNDMSMQVLDFTDALIRAVNDGLVPMERVDDAVHRILRVKARLGLLDGSAQRPDLSVIGCKKHMELAYRASLNSTVLLKNDGVLPLSTEAKVAVIGPNADDVRAQYGDWTYFTHPDLDPKATPKNDTVTVLGGIKSYLGDNVPYAKGAAVALDFSDEGMIEEALGVCKDADTVIAVIGDDVSLNGEWKDRAELDLSRSQRELLHRVSELGKRLVVILVNAKPLVLGEIESYASAIVEAFNGGDMCGAAVADLIFGKENFSAKLPISFPASSGCVPCYYNQYTYWHTHGGYVDMRKTVTFPFGYGLSYSRFEYSEPRVSKAQARVGETVTLTVDVTNLSDRDGTEVVQLYCKDDVCRILTPIRTLIDFKRVNIKAGKTATVSFTVPTDTLGYYDESCQYRVDPGSMTLYVSGDGTTFKAVSFDIV